MLLNGCGSRMAISLKENPPTNGTTPTTPAERIAQKSKLIKVSFLLTNDIHGHIENLSYLGGIVQQLRHKQEYQNDSAGLFILDSGDQFQGTLASNYDEGSTIFKSLNEIGYDAIIPGNHDYDFGPIGWLYDKVTTETSGDPREVIKKVALMAHFPMLSANTYFRASVKSKSSIIPYAIGANCKTTQQSLLDPLDFEKAIRPEFLKPYVILEKAGVRVALIGLDNHATTSMTTADNVSDLCFRDELSTYLEVRKSLEGKADVFVILLHGGNAGPGQNEASELAKQINSIYPNGVDLVAAGHTHYTHDAVSGGVHVIQDGANGKAYGRVDLFVSPKSKTVLGDLTESGAGIEMSGSICDDVKNPLFCSQLTLPVQALPSITQIVAEANELIAPLAKQKLGTAKGTIYVDRVNESPLGDILTGALRKATGTQIAIMNNGGIRISLKPGPVLYENLFEVSPFQNQAVIIHDFSWKKLKAVLEAAARTCGKYGSLSQSGLRVKYFRKCAGSTTVASESRLIHVETLDGDVLLDTPNGIEASADKILSLTTLDFLASGGGDGYIDFAGSVVDANPGIARELIVEIFKKEQPEFEAKVDGRFQNTFSEGVVINSRQVRLSR